MDQKNKNNDPSRKQRPGQTGIEANFSKRSKRFEIRFTQKEWEQLQKVAEERGFSSTAFFARSALLPKNHQLDAETKAEHRLRVQLLASLGKIGSNVNQIARSLNRLKIWNDTTKDMLIELQKIQQGIAIITENFGDRRWKMESMSHHQELSIGIEKDWNTV